MSVLDFLKKKNEQQQKTSDTPPSWEGKPKATFHQGHPTNNRFDNFLSGEEEGMRVRPFSSNKFDCLPKKSQNRRAKKLKQNLFEFAKMN